VYEIVEIWFPRQTVGFDAGLVTSHCPKTLVELKRKANKKTKKYDFIIKILFQLLNQ
jgi:hypothetical protein